MKGEELKRLRLEKGWSQEFLAWRAKISKSMISAIEGGYRNPSRETERRLRRALTTNRPLR